MHEYFFDWNSNRANLKAHFVFPFFFFFFFLSSDQWMFTVTFKRHTVLAFLSSHGHSKRDRRGETAARNRSREISSTRSFPARVKPPRKNASPQVSRFDSVDLWSVRSRSTARSMADLSPWLNLVLLLSLAVLPLLKLLARTFTRTLSVIYEMYWNLFVSIVDETRLSWRYVDKIKFLTNLRVQSRS